jgi:hypothetical protein
MTMAKKDDGGPAFPIVVPGIVYEDGSVELPYIDERGMSLRDHLAAKAPPVPDWWPEAERPPWRTYQLPFMNDAEKMELWRGWGDHLDDADIPAPVLAEFPDAEKAEAADDARRVRDTLAARMKRQTDWSYAYADAMIVARGS